jgi:hypothetical protein
MESEENAFKRAEDSLFLFKPVKLHSTRKSFSQKKIDSRVGKIRTSIFTKRPSTQPIKHLTHPKSCDNLT